MYPRNFPPLPPLTYHGYLPEGVHDSSMDEMRDRFATNPTRTMLFDRLQSFIGWAKLTGNFSHVYVNGGFATNKSFPDDVDAILQTKAPYGPEAFRAMEPFFAEGIEKIYAKYSVHLHFWCEGFPGGLSDFRRFFQYLRPQDAAPVGLREGAKKGIVRIAL